ncbi:hypothetical protein SPBR_05989 [Sporothrix brasiliensis 5110]|uniref:Uncharacterized protein n=1 Tax=Sporothrix brasiliensis 5110 TaxID=1398154 RepID=A0A0C2FTC8_9PEZI|nr:uncharacterized protein SPBR_05989 [Sporothrix brasiliensis 5110]KIH94288.1 hypothetical protein SPBR_05989 [Sporothrix brasiliensis 5110]
MAIHVFDKFYLGLTAVITVGYQLVFFAVAFCLHSDKLTDFAGGSNFVVLAVVTLVLGSRDPPYDTVAAVPQTRQLVITILMSVWAARLSSFLLVRILRTGHDSRFDNLRDRFFPLLQFWVGQMVWVWTASLPVTVLNSQTVQGAEQVGKMPPFGTARDIAGTIMFGIGFLCESVADAQRFRFRERKSADNSNSGLAFCHTGLFAWSRHPNYFGEILLQFGLFTIATSDTHFRAPYGTHPGFTSAIYATVVGPVLLTLVLLFVTGLPLSERSGAAKRYAAGGAIWDEYRLYLHRTSILIPMPPALYARLPVVVKRTLLLEFPMYVFVPGRNDSRTKDPQPATGPPQAINREAEHGDDPDAVPNDHHMPQSASTLSSAAK